jgi:ribosomal protein S18 acetylase RimI-like enzyme
VQIVHSGPGRSDLSEVLQHYKQCYGLSEQVLLNIMIEALARGQTGALVAQGSTPEAAPMGAIIFSRHGGHGEIHLLHACTDSARVEGMLLARAEVELAQEPGLEQISATLAIQSERTTEDVFRQRGYRVLSRARMVLDWEEGIAGEVVLPPGYELHPWTPRYREEVLALIETSHRNSPDLLMYPEMAGPKGAIYLLERVLGGGFGRFDPGLTHIALTGGTLAGFCLSVWHAALPEQGFIVDLAVSRPHQRCGLGRALVLATAQAFQQAGAKALGLAVTLGNQRALRLYQELGFQVGQYFSLFKLEVGG